MQKNDTNVSNLLVNIQGLLWIHLMMYKKVYNTLLLYQNFPKYNKIESIIMRLNKTHERYFETFSNFSKDEARSPSGFQIWASLEPSI